jgi:hypothetical protein
MMVLEYAEDGSSRNHLNTNKNHTLREFLFDCHTFMLDRVNFQVTVIKIAKLNGVVIAFNGNFLR